MSHPFLLRLDGLLHRDPHHPGFAGKLAVVVRGGSGEQCWLAAFTRHRASGEIRAFLPPDLDALILLDEEAARAITEGREVPSAGLARFAGDKALMKSFMDRYLKRNNFVGVRIDRGGSDGNAGRKARARASRASASRRRSR